jgi:hypothetical protein
LDNNLWMNLSLDKLISFSQEFTSKDSDGGGTITNFFILSSGNINQNFSCWIVNVNWLKNSGTIIGDGNLLSLLLVSELLKNLVHSLWAKSSLDEISNSDGSNERLLKKKRFLNICSKYSA